MDGAELLRWTRSVLETTPERWRGLSATLPADLFQRAPAPGEWSAADCLRHLLDAERLVFPVRVRCFLAGQDFPAFDPDRDGSRAGDAAPAALADAFARLRVASLTLLDSLKLDDLPRTAR